MALPPFPQHRPPSLPPLPVICVMHVAPACLDIDVSPSSNRQRASNWQHFRSQEYTLGLFCGDTMGSVALEAQSALRGHTGPSQAPEGEQESRPGSS